MNNIVDPVNGQTFSIFSEQGKALLKSYVKMYQRGGANQIEDTGCFGTDGLKLTDRNCSQHLSKDKCNHDVFCEYLDNGMTTRFTTKGCYGTDGLLQTDINCDKNYTDKGKDRCDKDLWCEWHESGRDTSVKKR